MKSWFIRGFISRFTLTPDSGDKIIWIPVNYTCISMKLYCSDVKTLYPVGYHQTLQSDIFYLFTHFSRIESDSPPHLHLERVNWRFFMTLLPCEDPTSRSHRCDLWARPEISEVEERTVKEEESPVLLVWCRRCESHDVFDGWSSVESFLQFLGFLWNILSLMSICSVRLKWRRRK